MAKRKLILALLNKPLKKRVEKIGDELLDFIKEGDTILDFGCGDMSLSKYLLSQKTIFLTGVDNVDYNVNDVNFVKYDGGRLPFNDNKFDVVFAIFVLHHTSGPEFYLRELIRVSKKKIVICEDTYTNKREEMFTKFVCYITNVLIGNLDMKRNFKSVKEWEELFVKFKIKPSTFKRFSPNKIKIPFARHVIIELRK